MDPLDALPRYSGADGPERDSEAGPPPAALDWLRLLKLLLTVAVLALTLLQAL